jgi:hypothetical protein
MCFVFFFAHHAGRLGGVKYEMRGRDEDDQAVEAGMWRMRAIRLQATEGALPLFSAGGEVCEGVGLQGGLLS